MKKEVFTIRLEPELVEQIKKCEAEGNVSRFIRIAIKEKLQKEKAAPT